MIVKLLDCVPIKSITLFKVFSEIFLVYLDKFIKFVEYPLYLLQNYIFAPFLQIIMWIQVRRLQSFGKNPSAIFANDMLWKYLFNLQNT